MNEAVKNFKRTSKKNNKCTKMERTGWVKACKGWLR